MDPAAKSQTVQEGNLKTKTKASCNRWMNCMKEGAGDPHVRDDPDATGVSLAHALSSWQGKSRLSSQ